MGNDFMAWVINSPPSTLPLCPSAPVFFLCAPRERLDSDAKELKDTLARVARHVLEREADVSDSVRIIDSVCT